MFFFLSVFDCLSLRSGLTSSFLADSSLKASEIEGIANASLPGMCLKTGREELCLSGGVFEFRIDFSSLPSSSCF
jgi:hypothetical protein